MKEYFEQLLVLESLVPLKEWRKASDAILLHTRGKKLDELLAQYRPNEPQDIKEYRLENSYLYTRDPFIKAIDAVKKSVKLVGISYDVQLEVEQILNEKQISTDLASLSLEQYLISIFQQVIEYPNAHLVWIPINNKINTNFNPINHPMGSNPTDKIGFEPYIATKVKYYDKNVCIWEMGQWTYRHEQKELKAPYYMGADKSGYYRYIPIGMKNGTIQYLYEPYYTPNGGLSQRPTRPLGGDLTSENINGTEKNYYVSFFANAAEFGKDFLSSYSDAKGVHIKNSHPLRVLNDAVCDACNGEGKRMVQNETKACSSCNGTGKTFISSPYGDIQRKKTGRQNEGATNTPFIEYYSSGSELLTYNKGYCFDTLFPKIEDALCLNYIRTAQSGTAKEEDKESYYAMLEKVINNYVELFEFSLTIIRDLLIYNPANRENIKVYSVRSIRGANTFDLVNDISKLSSTSLPIQMKSGIIKQYLVDIKDKYERKILEIILDYDVLFGKSDADILQLSAALNSPISKSDMEFHLRGRQYLTNLVEKYSDEFLNKSNQELYNEVINEIPQ